MSTYTIINGTSAILEGVNGADNGDVDPYTYRNAVTLTDAEVGALCRQQGVAVTSDLAGLTDAEQIKRVIAISSLYLNAQA